MDTVATMRAMIRGTSYMAPQMFTGRNLTKLRKKYARKLVNKDMMIQQRKQ